MKLTFLSVLGLEGPPEPEVEADHWQGEFAQHPVVTWKRRLPGPPFPAASHTELSSPVLHEDRIYVGAASDSALFVLAREDGRLLRRIEAGGPVQSSVVIGDDGLWFTDSGGYTHRVGLDGEQHWRHFSGAPILSEPTLHDGRIYIANVDNLVYALDAQTGDLVWRHAQKLDPGRVTELELYAAPSPVVVGDLVITGYSDGTLAALGKDSGEMVWQRRVGEGRYPDVAASAVVRGGDVIVGGYTEPLLALDVASRNVRWRVDAGAAAPPILSPDDERVVFHGGADGVLRRIDALTGAVDWEWDSQTGASLTQPVWTEAGLLVGSSASGVFLVDPKSGKELWELELGYTLAGVSARPAVAGRQAVVVTNAGNILSIVSPSPVIDQDDSVFSRLE